MTGLIRAEAAAFVVRPFAEPERPVRPDLAPVPQRSGPEERAESLARENAELRQLLAAAQEEVGKAELRGREDGRRDAEAAARGDDDRRLEAIGKGAAAALGEWRARLAELEKLAPLIARSALARLFDAPQRPGDLVAGMIAAQIGRLDRDAVVAVQVSPLDFADPQALLELRDGLGAELSIACDAALGAGESRIDLRLGHVDISVEDQWAQLSALLLELGGESA